MEGRGWELNHSRPKGLVGFVTSGDHAKVASLLLNESAQLPRPILGTFCRRPTLAGAPTIQFEAKLVPFAVSERGVRVCLQKMGEERFVEAPAGQARGVGVEEGVFAHRVAATRQVPAQRAEQPLGALSDHDLEREVAPDDHVWEFGTETSFAVSKTTVSGRPRSPRTRTVAVQTSPARPPGRPPLVPEPHELAAAERAGRPSRRRVVSRQAPLGRAPVSLRSSRRQVRDFEETPRQTRVLRLKDAMGGINACGRGCCNLHISVAAARRALDDIDREVCGSVEFGCQQCPECLALIDPEDSEEGADGSALQECETCGKGICPQPPRGSSTHAASDETHQEALARTPCSRASMFKVTLDRSGGAKLGLDLNFDSSEGLVLLVERVGEGLVEQWNSSNEQADVRSGDYLVQVNGVDGSSMRMLAELREDKLLEIVVLRSDAI